MGYSNAEYVALLRERNALPFVEDLKITLVIVIGRLQPQSSDETPRAYADRMSRSASDLTRLLLRIQDGKTS